MPTIVFPHPRGPLSGPGTLGGYRISSLFGTRVDPITGQAGTGHGGIDLVMPIGTPVHAVASGTFQPLDPANSGGGGNWAGLLFDDGNYWGTGHCDRFVARYGQHVAAGELIAYSGNTGKSTGPHGHESFRPVGQWRYDDPYDLLLEAQNANRYPGSTPTPTPAPPVTLKEAADMGCVFTIPGKGQFVIDGGKAQPVVSDGHRRLLLRTLNAVKHPLANGDEWIDITAPDEVEAFHKVYGFR